MVKKNFPSFLPQPRQASKYPLHLSLQSKHFPNPATGSVTFQGPKFFFIFSMHPTLCRHLALSPKSHRLNPSKLKARSQQTLSLSIFQALQAICSLLQLLMSTIVAGNRSLTVHKMNGCDCVPIKPSLPKQVASQMWPMSCSLLTSCPWPSGVGG